MRPQQRRPPRSLSAVVNNFKSGCDGDNGSKSLRARIQGIDQSEYRAYRGPRLSREALEAWRRGCLRRGVPEDEVFHEIGTCVLPEMEELAAAAALHALLLEGRIDIIIADNARATFVVTDGGTQ